MWQNPETREYGYYRPWDGGIGGNTVVSTSLGYLVSSMRDSVRGPEPIFKEPFDPAGGVPKRAYPYNPGLTAKLRPLNEEEIRLFKARLNIP